MAQLIGNKLSNIDRPRLQFEGREDFWRQDISDIGEYGANQGRRKRSPSANPT
jgi:hypothetical protein